MTKPEPTPFLDLENRVSKFNGLALPGQPHSMHMATSYLVNDLWREVRDLADELDAAREEIERYAVGVCEVCQHERWRAAIRARGKEPTDDEA